MAKQEDNKRKGITFREIIGGDFLTRQSMVRQMPLVTDLMTLEAALRADCGISAGTRCDAVYGAATCSDIDCSTETGWL